jgi:hypothetical protein
MTESSEERAGIADEQLPPDLVPGDDNPLAEPLEEGEDAGDLLEEGKRAAESADDTGDESTDEPGDQPS